MFTIYTKDNCPNCDKAKSLLTQKGIEFQTVKLGADITREQLLEKIPTARTMPQIMLDDKVIGGVAELNRMLSV